MMDLYFGSGWFFFCWLTKEGGEEEREEREEAKRFQRERVCVFSCEEKTILAQRNSRGRDCCTPQGEGTWLCVKVKKGSLRGYKFYVEAFQDVHHSSIMINTWGTSFPTGCPRNRKLEGQRLSL